MADYIYKKIPRVIRREERDYTQVAIHKCFCRRGTIEHCRVPGFDDEWFEILCPRCAKKYEPYIDQCGPMWRVYFNEDGDEPDELDEPEWLDG